MRLDWKERYSKGGVCDFRQNYDFYFKWLLNKTMSCFYITGLPDTVNPEYLKSNLLLNGNIGITEFNGNLYACIGSVGGPPNEYYVGTVYTLANPVLGSKMMDIGKDGVVIYNNSIDEFTGDAFVSGIYELINQTATLLADNIISINCNQINSRVQAMATADSEAQALGAEIVLKKMYAGQPYQVLRSDLIDKINVNPINTSANAQNLAELVELHNYIISNYFQSIGIRANDIRKKSHVLQDEIDVQNDYLQVSILEILTSWQAGFDKVNALFGTNIRVELNPALIHTLIDNEFGDDNVNDNTDITNNTDDSDTQNVSEVSNEELVDSNSSDESIDTSVDSIDTDKLVNDVINSNEQIESIVDIINDTDVQNEIDVQDELGDGETSESNIDSE